MRGFLLGALILIGLEVALTSSAPRIAGALPPVTGWLVSWTDPTVPLIPGPAPGPAPGKKTGPGSAPGKTVRQRAGKCPPGYLPDDRHPGYCIQTHA